MAELLSFYHMFILDSEREKRCLRDKLKAAEAKVQENEDMNSKVDNDFVPEMNDIVNGKVRSTQVDTSKYA